MFHDPRGGMHFDGRYARVRDADADADAEAAASEAAAGGRGVTGREDVAEGPKRVEASERAEVTKHGDAAEREPVATPAPGPFAASSRWRGDREIPETLRLRAIEAMLPEGEIEGEAGSG